MLNVKTHRNPLVMKHSFFSGSDGGDSALQVRSVARPQEHV